MAKFEPFGQVVVKLGFASQGQIETALEIQQSLSHAGKKRKLLGMILLETGIISSGQLIEILQYYEFRRRADQTAQEEKDGQDDPLPTP